LKRPIKISYLILENTSARQTLEETLKPRQKTPGKTRLPWIKEAIIKTNIAILICGRNLGGSISAVG
jgi:hypothetical protein